MSDLVQIRDVGDTLTAVLASAFDAIVAGGAGNGVAVTGAKVDRLDPNTGSLANSAKFVLAWSATLAATKSLNLTAVKIEQSIDGTTWDAAAFQTFTDPGTVATSAAGGTVTGTTSFAVELDPAKRFVRIDFTPTLTNTVTDTATIVALAVLGGFDRLAA
jgi:hypothetical protein